MVAFAECFAPEKPLPEPKTRVWDFFDGAPDRVGELASQVVDRDWEITFRIYDSRRAPSLARSEQARPQNYYEVWSSLGDARGRIDGVGLANSLIVLATDEAAMLAKGGQFRLDANRVRSLKYFGNQYDPAELVQMAKNNQLRLAKISKVAGGAGYVLTGVNAAADIYMVPNGDLSAGRFLYRSAGNAAVITLAVAGSGGAAAIVGIGWYAGEQTYDHVIQPGIEKGAELNVRTENWLRDRALNQVRY